MTYPLGLALGVFTATSVALLLLLIGVSSIVRARPARRSSPETYECGMPPGPEHRTIEFAYLEYAMLFLAADLLALYAFLSAAIPPTLATLGILGLVAATLILLVAGIRRHHGTHRA